MKKIIYLICSVFISFSAYATEMCAHRDVTVVPLDATIPGIGRTGYGNDGIEKIWWTTFEYGKIYGVATCLSKKEIMEIENVQELKDVPSVLSTDDYELMGRDGYYNNDTSDESLYGRRFCFCKLTHPMSSRWILRHIDNNPNANKCTINCLSACNWSTDGTGIDFRTVMFKSIGK